MRFFLDIVDIIFPNSCCACNGPLVQKEERICFTCRSEMPKINFTNLRENELVDRLYGKINITYGSAYLFFYKSGITQKLLHHLKYENMPDLAEMLGRWYGFDIIEYIKEEQIDYIVPVPLHPKKERARGYNQSLHIAKGISQATEIPIANDVLQRQHYEKSQTVKSREQRWESVSDAFSIIDKAKIKGKHIMIVDDVITTGATIEACARQVYENGAHKISIAALALAK